MNHTVLSSSIGPLDVRWNVEEEDLTLHLKLVEEKPTQTNCVQLPEPFDPDLALDRLRIVVEWLFDLDGSMKRTLAKGKTVTKGIPLRTNSRVSKHQWPESVEDYWALRPSSGLLVRPLLLPPTDMQFLYEYQREGVAWLLSHTRGILADDMGLGKTLQGIVAAAELIRKGKIRFVLVAAPKSLLSTWKAEFERWAPQLMTVLAVPRESGKEESWRAVLRRFHIVITNYEQLREPPECLLSSRIDLVIADEAHRLRNWDSQTSSSVRDLSAGGFWALTGTPLERDAVDIVTLLSIIEPAKFSASDSRLPPSAMRTAARPYVLRRSKVDVLSELPPVVEVSEVIELSEPQRLAYVRRLSEFAASPDSNGLELINDLRVLCDYDPRTKESSKAVRIVELLQDIHSSGGKAVVFSYLLEPLRILQDMLRQTDPEIGSHLFTGSLSTEDRERTLEEFRANASITALLASSRVAGEGLTLTEANNVIFFNQWWNPSANRQARDRVVRIGQERLVSVFKLRCRNTVEDYLERVLGRKTIQEEQIVGLLTEERLRAGGNNLRELIADLVEGQLAAWNQPAR